MGARIRGRVECLARGKINDSSEKRKKTERRKCRINVAIKGGIGIRVVALKVEPANLGTVLTLYWSKILLRYMRHDYM